MSSVELVQIVIRVDGKLCQVVIPAGRETYLLHMMSGVFDNGKLNAVRLPESFTTINLAEELSKESANAGSAKG